MFISHNNGHGIKLVRPVSTVDNTPDYARVSHSRQWSNYNINNRGYNTPLGKQNSPLPSDRHHLSCDKIVWRRTVKIIRTVQCCAVYCTQL